MDSIMTTTSPINNDEHKRFAQNENDDVSITSVDVENIEVAVGDDKEKEKKISKRREPGVGMEGIHVAAILAGIIGIGSGVAAGMFTKRSYLQDSSPEDDLNLSVDVIAARVAGFLSVGSFMAATPTLFCAATSYLHQRRAEFQPSARISVMVSHKKEKEGSKHEGLPELCSWAWIMYGAGVFNVVLLLLTCMFSPKFSITFWVYFATLFNVLPFIMMMIHAEAARKF